MTTNNEIDQLSKEFDDFSKIAPEKIPSNIEEDILKQASQDLLKTKIKALTAVSFIHLIAGAFIISVCPQFDIQFFPNFMGLLSIFMRFGHNVCMFLCGSLFISASVTASAIILPKVYKQYLYSIRYYKIAGLAIGSLLVFSLVSVVPLTVPTLLWLAGALIFGQLTSKLYFVRIEI